MDRDELRHRLEAFERLGQQGTLPFKVARLEDDVSGFGNGTYILRIVAPWAAGKSFDEIMDPFGALVAEY